MLLKKPFYRFHQLKEFSREFLSAKLLIMTYTALGASILYYGIGIWVVLLRTFSIPYWSLKSVLKYFQKKAELLFEEIELLTVYEKSFKFYAWW